MSAKNPILEDSAIAGRFAALPPEAREALGDFCHWLYGHSRDQAERSWRAKKAPMAVYWSAVKAWAFHLRRAARSPHHPITVSPHQQPEAAP